MQREVTKGSADTIGPVKRVTIILLALAAAVSVAGQGRSRWVHLDRQQKLRYATDQRGNRIMDFSHAGYRGGGVALPVVPVVRTLSAFAGDTTSLIQAALDEVSRGPIGSDGFRGAVLLQPGTYEVSGTLRIAASGVVLRGSGSGETGTIIRVTGPPHRLLDVTGTGTWQPDGAPAAIVDAYVPSGAGHVRVDGASRFKPGDRVLIRRPVTPAWIRFMNMDVLSRDGKPQVWIEPGTTIDADRTIASIAGDRVALDVPLSDSYDAAHLNPPGATMVRYVFPGRIEQVGFESTRVVVPPRDAPITEGQYMLLRMNAVSDGWVRDIAVADTQNSDRARADLPPDHAGRCPHPPHGAVQRSGVACRHRHLGHADSRAPFDRAGQACVAGRHASRRDGTECRAQLQEQTRQASRHTSGGPPGYSWTAANS